MREILGPVQLLAPGKRPHVCLAGELLAEAGLRLLLENDAPLLENDAMMYEVQIFTGRFFRHILKKHAFVIYRH